MKKLAGVIFISLFLLIWAFYPVQAQDEQGSAQRDAQFEQAVAERLAKVNPEAVQVFQSATTALDKGDLGAAQKGFEQVLALAPDFPDALRRLSQTLYQQDQSEQAEKLARQALAAAHAPENESWLAVVLLRVNTPASDMEAYNLAKEAVQADPEDPYYQNTLMFASAATTQLEDLRQSSAALIRLTPQNPWGHFYAGLLAADDQRWEQAESELLLARQLGAPAEEVQKVLDGGISSQALIQRLIRGGLYGLAGWVGMLGLLFIIGVILSQATLASVNRQKGLTRMEINPAERLVRRVYRGVIAITSAYFYLSIPILLIIVVAVTGLIFYAFLAIGQVPIRLAILILLACLYTLYTVVRSLFISRRQVDPGKLLDRASAQPLWDLLLETARKVGTRPVDKVFVSAGTNIAVYERGSWWKRLHGQGERCLVLGMGALPGMNQGQLRAIIAHEYGHFNNADTAGGDLANAVTFNIQIMAQGLGGSATGGWLNPVWLFINGYYRIFLRITQGASRLQEILADRYATIQYGVRNMKSGLEHVIRQSLLFDAQVNGEIQLAIQFNRSLQNLYTLPKDETDRNVEEAFQKIMKERTSVYSSHPSPRDRLAFIERVQNSGLIQEDNRPTWDLLSAFAALQEEMTREIQENLCQRGVLKIDPSSQ